MTNEIYTRKQYMQDYSAVFASNPHIGSPFIELREETNKLHRKYYAQFVNARTINFVVSTIGKDKLLSSTDEHLNDIPLHLWDNMCKFLPKAMAMEKAGDYYTLSNGVCIAKEAARQWIDASKG